MNVPIPTPIYRMIHADCLRTILLRGALHSANHTPADGLSYRTIHNVEIQGQRHIRNIPCGPRGTLHDYVPFYFGYLSPMLFQLKTGRVAGYSEGQAPLVYLKTSVQAVERAGLAFVFSDGHAIAAFTEWFTDTAQLDKVDWQMVYQRYWRDEVNDMDRQRRKQAEFLIHHLCPWALIEEIGVLNTAMKTRVEAILGEFDEGLGKVVNVRSGWYY